MFDIADRFVVLDRGKVALSTDKREVKSAEHLVNYMEELAHPGGLPGLSNAEDTEHAGR